jgi:hypothetical protein
MGTKIKEGQKIIWDSSFGFEIGEFLKYLNDDAECEIDIKTGTICGPMNVYSSEVIPYTKENHENIRQKYS